MRQVELAIDGLRWLLEWGFPVEEMSSHDPEERECLEALLLAFENGMQQLEDAEETVRDCGKDKVIRKYYCAVMNTISLLDQLERKLEV